SHEFFQDCKRDAKGHCSTGSGGGAKTSGGDAKPKGGKEEDGQKSKKPEGGKGENGKSKGGQSDKSALNKLASLGKKGLDGTVKAEHGVRDAIKHQFQKLPESMQAPIAGFLNAFYGTYVLAQDTADKVAKAQGMDDKQRQSLSTALCAVDAIGMKLNAVAGTTLGGPLAGT